jgi:hypothetical protein
MGWDAWLPGMECYHGVMSLDHAITGNLVINGRKTDFPVVEWRAAQSADCHTKGPLHQ